MLRCGASETVIHQWVCRELGLISMLLEGNAGELPCFWEGIVSLIDLCIMAIGMPSCFSPLTFTRTLDGEFKLLNPNICNTPYQLEWSSSLGGLVRSLIIIVSLCRTTSSSINIVIYSTSLWESKQTKYNLSVHITIYSTFLPVISWCRCEGSYLLELKGFLLSFTDLHRGLFASWSWYFQIGWDNHQVRGSLSIQYLSCLRSRCVNT